MKRITRRLSRNEVSWRFWLAFLIVGTGLWDCLRAEAAPIRHHEFISVNWKAFQLWSRYLLAGPSIWERIAHPAVTTSVRSAIWESIRTDRAGADPMVRFLLWRQGIDLPRFRHYHPRLTPVLNKIRRLTTTPGQLIPLTTVSSNGVPSTPILSPTTPPEGNLNPLTVSEPGTLFVALGIAGWGVWRTRRQRSRG
jgi:hypothetical protein